MTADGWRQVVERAAHDTPMRDLLVQLLVEQDAAKARLQERFSCTGRPWPALADDVIDRAGATAIGAMSTLSDPAFTPPGVPPAKKPRRR